MKSFLVDRLVGFLFGESNHEASKWQSLSASKFPSAVLEFMELSRFLFSFFSIEDLMDLSVFRILKRLTFSHRYIPENTGMDLVSS